MAELSLGIDFGTSTTAVAFREHGGFPEMLGIGENRRPYMPSAVAFLRRPDGGYDTVFGEDALRAGKGAEVITSIKRCLHCDGTRCLDRRSSASTKPSRRQRQAANASRCEKGQIQAGGRLWKPEEIALLIVEEALRRACRLLQGDHGDCSLDQLALLPTNLGCSVAFDLDQRQLLVRIARQLGFNVLSLKNVVEEPVAAGIGFANMEGLKPGRTLVYDFGGGTFDAAVIHVSRDGEQVAVLASGGVPFLGGDDIDGMIIDHFLKELGRTHELTEAEIRDQLDKSFDERELRSQAEAAKIDLSQASDVEVTLNLSLRNDPYTMHLDRKTLEQLLTTERRFDGYSLFARSLTCVTDVLRKARVYQEGRDNGGRVDKERLGALTLDELRQDIDYVLLVGGVTKIPFVKRQLEDAFGQDRIFEGYVLDDPITAVARGAAYDKEYENLVLAAPPYSVIVEHPNEASSQPAEAYRAYSVLWPNAYSAGRSDFKYLSDFINIYGAFAVRLLRHDTGARADVYRGTSSGYVRVEIDPWARIYVLEGPHPRSLTQRFRAQAPWKHDLQVIQELKDSYDGLIDNSRSTMTEN